MRRTGAFSSLLLLAAAVVGWQTGGEAGVSRIAGGNATSQRAVLAPAPDAIRTPTSARPRVRLVATGGTIANHPAARLTARELAESIPDLDRTVDVEWEQFSNVASGELRLSDYLGLSRRIDAVLRDDPGLSGIVVTSGTDTLEEIAYFRHLTVRHDRPVVLVGAMRSPERLGYEGPANLLAGFRVAADPASRGLGALVVLNDTIDAARDVTKTDALRLDTFSSRSLGVLGVVDPDRVVYYRRPTHRTSRESEFDITGVDRLPRVDVLLVYQDAPGDLTEAAVDAGAKGLVMATAGAGATSGTQGEGLDYAAEHGVFVVVSTRTGSGRIADARAALPAAASSEAARRRREFLIAAEDLTPIKARLLLMLGLTRTSDRDELQRMFREY